jgi:hypothetical protein
MTREVPPFVFPAEQFLVSRTSHRMQIRLFDNVGRGIVRPQGDATQETHWAHRSLIEEFDHASLVRFHHDPG